MSPDLEQLIALQNLESAIEESRRRIAAHPQRIADAEARLAHAKEAVEAAKQRFKASQEARREAEREAATYQSRLTKFKDQLSAVKTNREYQAMQHEIETAQKELGTVEETVIERMVEADALTADVKKAEQASAAQQKDVDAERKTLTEELATVEAALKDATHHVARAAARRALRAGRARTQRSRDCAGDARRALLRVPRAAAPAGLPGSPPQRSDHSVRQLQPHPLLHSSTGGA